MTEQSANVTLEQAIIFQNKSQLSLLDESAIEYEEGYSFLSDISLTEQHVQISNVRLNPPLEDYQVRFYEVKSQLKPQKSTMVQDCEPDLIYQKKHRHKIMAMNVKQSSTWEKTVRLPRCSNPLELQVQSKTKGVLFGKIKQEESEMESPLYNAKGEKVATIQYELKVANNKKDESRLSCFLGQRSNTLHSKDFESQSESASGLRELNNDQKLIRIQQQLSDRLGKIEEEDEQKADKITTMSTSSKVVRIIRRRKKLQHLSEENSQIQQKGEQDYELNLQEKVSSYRNPFQKKEKYFNQPKQEVDFMSLKRSKEELGISFMNIEDIIYPKSLRKAIVDTPQIKEEEQKLPVIVQNPQIKVKTQPTVASHRVSYQDCGVGTYTPLSTLKNTLKQSYNSFRQKNLSTQGVQTKIAKSTNVKLQKISKQKKRYNRELQMNYSQEEQPSARRIHTQKKSILNKFFMTNRQQDRQVQQPNHDNQREQKKPQKPRQHLSVQNKVLEIKVQQFPKVQHKIQKAQESITPVSLQKIRPKHKKSHSCRDTPPKIESELVSLSDSQLYPEYNLTINNISLNFRRKTFGSKQLMIKMNQTGYLTEQMVGNNLMWASKSYRFERVSQNDQIHIDVRGQSSEHQFTYGTVKIAFNDLLINKKQRYYQTFLLGEKEVLGILILGYEILKKRDSMKNYMFIQDQRKLHVHSQVKRVQYSQSRQAKKLKKLQNYLNDDVKKKLPSPQTNKIKAKKYLGGKNIKIGRAHRFQDSSNLLNPGPGEYHIESDFSRHAQKQD